MPSPSPVLNPADLVFPGETIHNFTWDPHGDRYFAHGVDRGVLYPHGLPPVVWNGIIGIEESGAGERTVLYRDGHIYHSEVEPGDFEGQLTAYFFPDEFSDCAGLPRVAPGLIATNQKPIPFDLSYRTLIGSGQRGDMFGYQINLLYNATAALGTRSRKTATREVQVTEFTFDIVATPEKIDQYRPTAHYIIDTRYLTETAIQSLEHILYGYEDVEGRLPKPQELFDILTYDGNIAVNDYGDSWVLRGPADKLEVDELSGEWVLLDADVTINPDGSFVLNYP